jgi:quinol monooxygenase YgiN
LQSNHFVSFGSWMDLVVVDKWRNSPEFKQFSEKISELIDRVEVYTLDKIVDTEKFT